MWWIIWSFVGVVAAAILYSGINQDEIPDELSYFKMSEQLDSSKVQDLALIATGSKINGWTFAKSEQVGDDGRIKVKDFYLHQPITTSKWSDITLAVACVSDAVVVKIISSDSDKLPIFNSNSVLKNIYLKSSTHKDLNPSGWEVVYSTAGGFVATYQYPHHFINRLTDFSTKTAYSASFEFYNPENPKEDLKHSFQLSGIEALSYFKGNFYECANRQKAKK